MSYSIIEGQTGLVDAPTAILSTGWTIDGVYATHGGCNPGTMVSLNDFGLVIGRAYIFTYTIDQWSSGGVRLIAGTTPGTYFAANGTNSEQLVMAGNIYISFYSDGNLRISSLNFYDAVTGVQAGQTIAFNEREKKWHSESSAIPEMIIGFREKLFMFQNGGLWQSFTNTLMNNLFGHQYSSQVTFIFNADYKKNKLWYNLRVDGVGGWYVANITIPPNDQFPNGMQSVITKSNIKSIDGKLWADILRDMTDPAFAGIPDQQLREAVALFQGRLLQGTYIIVTLQCDDTTPASLESIEAYYIDVEKSL